MSAYLIGISFLGQYKIDSISKIMSPILQLLLAICLSFFMKNHQVQETLWKELFKFISNQLLMSLSSKQLKRFLNFEIFFKGIPRIDKVNRELLAWEAGRTALNNLILLIGNYSKEISQCFTVPALHNQKNHVGSGEEFRKEQGYTAG
ncbi:hypothetical protein BYT27DRAFT_7269997 [Phlegmacium glaucopus]|nr:hypothetical protein BYT27DRAFT_7269997 [Phlegmacium glaucopus]